MYAASESSLYCAKSVLEIHGYIDGNSHPIANSLLAMNSCIESVQEGSETATLHTFSRCHFFNTAMKNKHFSNEDNF